MYLLRGSATILSASTSSRVRALRLWAWGFPIALRWAFTARSARSSSVAPWRCMYALAIRAVMPGMVRPTVRSSWVAILARTPAASLGSRWDSFSAASTRTVSCCPEATAQ